MTTLRRSILPSLLLLLCGCPTTHGADAGDAADGTPQDGADVVVPPDGGDAAGDRADAGNPPVAATAFCQAIGDLYCAANQTCCTDPARRYPSISACLSTYVPACQMQLQPTLTDPRTAYNPQRAGDLIAWLQSWAGACSTAPFDPRSLADIFDGTAGVGSDCTPTGAGNIAPFYSCLRGLACDLPMNGTSGTCQPITGAGTPCRATSTCQSGLFCASGTCSPTLSTGAPCSDPTQCTSERCAGTCVTPTPNDLYCM